MERIRQFVLKGIFEPNTKTPKFDILGILGDKVESVSLYPEIGKHYVFNTIDCNGHVRQIITTRVNEVEEDEDYFTVTTQNTTYLFWDITEPFDVDCCPHCGKEM